MTRSAAVIVLALLVAPSLLAQAKNMGQAQQYYQQKPKIHLVPGGKREKGGDIKYTVGNPNTPNRSEIVKGEYMILQPDVYVEYQDVKVHADKATVNLRTKDVTLEGHVVIDQGPTRLSGTQAFYNLDTKLGTFFNAKGQMDPSIYFEGEKMEKLSEDTYRLSNGIFTSCDIDNPSWSFYVKQADITLDDYAHFRDFVFRAHRLPIFWAPRLVWPTKRDRARGFLMPRILLTEWPGKANPSPTSLGNRLELGYFIPIGDSMDTTLYADLNTRGYNGLGINFRYRPSRDVKLGDLSIFGIHDALGKKEQWRYNYQHSQDNLPGGFRGVVDIEDFSDLDFFRRYERDPRLHTLSQIYSSTYLTKNSNLYSVNFLADRRDIVLGHVDPANIESPIAKQRYEQLPTAQFRLYPDRIGNTPLYLALESSVSHLQLKGLLQGPEASYMRADFFPTLSMQIRTPAWFSIRPQISARETYYSSQLSDQSVQNPAAFQTTTDQSLSRYYAQGQIDFVGPSFSRVFDKSLGGFSRFKHVIEPRLRYLYTTDVAEQNRVIRFDTVDTPSLPIVRDSLEYSLTQRLIGKESGPNGNAREVLSFELRQTVSLSKPFTDATGGNIPGQTLPAGETSKFTPMVASLHVNPYQSITLDANTTIGNLSHKIDQTSLSANLIGTGKNQDKYLSFTWFASFPHTVDNQPTVLTSTSSSQIRINTGSSLLHDRIRADVQLNFDAKQGTFLEQRYLIGGNAACYGIAFEYRRYLVYDPFPRPANSFGIAVSLKNVGTIASH